MFKPIRVSIFTTLIDFISIISSHLSPTSQTSLESSNGQPSPVSTTSIPPPPTPPPPPPPITRKHPANLLQNIKQRVPYDPFANHATVHPTTIIEPTSFTVANNSPELKQDKNGAITHYKARFVATCFKKQPGINFYKTFSPVVKSITIRVVLSLAVTNDWPLRQLDIQNAFLHVNLKEQAPCAWFELLSKALFDLGFKGSKTDPSLFIYSCGDTLLYIMVYVDDIIVIVKRILRYLHGTVKHGMLIRRSAGSTLQAFTDVLWKEAEYKALADTIAELTWLQALLNNPFIFNSYTMM
nr:hypothetical protein [Tanacetum cinerariifolium]